MTDTSPVTRALRAERVVLETGQVGELETGGARPAGQFRRPDQPGVAVRAHRQEPHHVFGADDGEGEGLGVAVDGRDDHVAAGPHEAGERRDDGRRVGHVLQHLEAGDDVEARGRRFGQCFDRDLPVFHRQAGLDGVQPCDGERFRREVDPEYPGTPARHAFGQQAAPATDVEDLPARETGTRLDVVEPGGIEVVQGPEFAVRVPPARRRRVEFRDLRGVDVRAVLHP